ncbi:MAG: alpha/beta hydrolase [Verrucomicrobia bacterium]|nr:alpha/beta hydrolase [Verrucomicrobiota bacterium]
MQVILTGSRDYVIGQANKATVTIDDLNTARWRSELIQPNSVAGTDGPKGLIRVTRLGTVLTDMTMAYQVLGQRTLLSSGIVHDFDKVPPGTSASYQLTVTGGRLGTTAGTLLMSKGIVTMEVGLKATLTSKEVAGATLRLANGTTAEISHPVVFLDRWHLVTLDRSDQQVTEGARPVVKLTAAARDPAGTPTTVRLHLSGTATAAADFTLTGAAGAIIANADGTRSVDVVIPAAPTSGSIRSATLTINTSADGKSEPLSETLVIRHEPGQISSAHNAVLNPRAYAAVQIRDNTAVVFPALDCDQDGLPDTYEVDHDHDPLTPTRVLADEDHDGVLDLDELVRGTGYDDSDSDNDGVNDFLESLVGSNPLVADAGLAMATRDHVPVRLTTAGTLRAPDGACFRCHAPGMTLAGVEQLSHLRALDSESLMLSRNLLLAPGTSHEITLTEPQGYVANPTKLSTYTAQIEALDSTRPPGFIVLETDAAKPLLGVNRPVETATFTTRRATLRILNRPKLAVDANRDGTIRFDASDGTSSKRPYRFWVNNDQDSAGLSANPGPDHADGIIQNAMDLEDFSRLWMDLQGLQDGLNLADITYAFEWRNVTEGTPAIQIYRQQESGGGLGYLLDSAKAALQCRSGAVIPAFAQALQATGGGRQIQAGSPFGLPYSTWYTGPNLRHFLFEAVSPGKGQLVVTLRKGTAILVESEPIQLELLDIKQMYSRVHATPLAPFTQPYKHIADQPKDPVVGFTLLDDEFEVKEDVASDEEIAVFVHGWNMTDAEALKFSETKYKRMWHAGYRGGFAMFRWPTDSLITPEVLDFEFFDSYNMSEHRAFEYSFGLKKFFETLSPQQRGPVICHSMGAVVVAGALASGMNASKVLFFQGAAPASMFDTRDALAIGPLVTAENLALTGLKTPDRFLDQRGYRGFVPIAFAELYNYHNADDFALQTGSFAKNLLDVNWVRNQQLSKPHLPDRNLNNGYVWYSASMLGGVNSQAFLALRAAQFIIRRTVQSDNEVLAFVARSRTRALGAEPSIQGPFLPANSRNLGAMGLQRTRSDHSGQYLRPIHETWPIYRSIVSDISTP